MSGLFGVWIDDTRRAIWISRRGALVVRSVDEPARAEWLPASITDELVVIEAGMVGIGPTVELRDTGGALVPRVSMGLYDDYEDDLGVPWAFPLGPYGRARAADWERVLAHDFPLEGPIALALATDEPPEQLARRIEGTRAAVIALRPGELTVRIDEGARLALGALLQATRSSVRSIRELEPGSVHRA